MALIVSLNSRQARLDASSASTRVLFSVAPEDGSLTNVKLSNMADGTVKGRALGDGTGAPDDLDADELATLVYSSAVGDMAQATVKGRASGAGTGAPQDLTPAQVGTIISGITSTWTGNHTFNPVSGNAVSVNVGAGDGLGINITNAGSSKNLVSSASNYYYNKIAVSSDASIGSAAYSTCAMYTELDVFNSAAKGQKVALRSLVNQSSASLTTGGDAIGISGWAISNTPNGGTDLAGNAAGTLFGGESVAMAFIGATNYFAVSGHEFGSIIYSGASTKHRWGINISGNGDVRGTSTDAAIQIGCPSANGSFSTTLLLSNANGYAPIPTTGTVIGSDGSIVTATNFVSLPTYTFSGNIFDFGLPLKITGAGVTTISGNAAALPTAPGGTMALFAAADNAVSRVTVDAYGSGFPSIFFRKARGSAAAGSQTAVQTNDVLMQFGGVGYGATGYSGAARASVSVLASENWTDAAQGADLIINTTPNGTATSVAAFTFSNAGNLSLNTGVLQIAATKVVGARSTGWTAMTGTPDKSTAYATSTVTLPQLAGRVMSLQAALTTHGLIGA